MTERDLIYDLLEQEAEIQLVYMPKMHKFIAYARGY